MCEDNKSKITMNKYYVKLGDEIEFLPNNVRKKEISKVLLKGIVTKVLENSVIVDISKDRNYHKYYDHDHTVINHRKYKIIAGVSTNK